MKRIALKFGLIAGAILGAMIVVTIPLYRRGVIGFENGELIGFSSMVLAFLLVFFGIRSYREEVRGGTIGFWKAVGVGLLITLVACTVYVLTWQVMYFGFFPDFIDQYERAHASPRCAPRARARRRSRRSRRRWRSSPSSTRTRSSTSASPTSRSSPSASW